MHERTNIQLSAIDRSALEAVVANRNSTQKHVWRAKIVLMTADGYGTARNYVRHRQGQDGDLALAGTVPGRGRGGALARQDAPLAHSTAEPCSGRTGCRHDLGGAAASGQPLDRRGDGEGGWDQRQFGATDLARSWPATASGTLL
jgi:hypothetical protein